MVYKRLGAEPPTVKLCKVRPPMSMLSIVCFIILQYLLFIYLFIYLFILFSQNPAKQLKYRIVKNKEISKAVYPFPVFLNLQGIE